MQQNKFINKYHEIQLKTLTSLLEIFVRFRILKQTHQRLLARSHQNKSSKHLPHSPKEVSHYLCFVHTSNGKGFREGTYIEHDRAPPSKRNIMIRLFWVLDGYWNILNSQQYCVVIASLTCSSPFISTLIWSLMAPDTLDLSERFSKLYHTSISPDRVRTSIMVCPRKSSDSRVNFCRNLDFKSLSSSQTLTLIRSDELWHSLYD